MRQLGRLFSFILVLGFSISTWAAPDVLNFQAQIRKPDGSTLEASDVSFRFKYLNAAGTCTVYIEDFSNLSMVGSAGNVSIKMGSGTRVFPATGPTKLVDTLSNRLSNSMDCWEHPGVSPYAPLASNENRKLKVEFNYTGSGGVQAINGIEINSVPYAMYATEANNTERLDGFAANLFTKFSDFATCSGGQFLLYNGSAFVCDTPTSTNFTGNLSGDVTGTQAATSVTGLRGIPLAVTAPTLNQVLQFDGTNWIPKTIVTSGGTVTNVTAAAPLLSSGGATPNISMPAATTSVDGYLSAADFTNFNNKVSSQWIAAAPNIYYNTGAVGIGTATPVYKLDVAGDINVTGKFKINGVNISEGTIGGSGTTNKVSKFTAAGAIGDSNITDSGTLVSIATEARVSGVNIGRGSGGVVSNTALGMDALRSNTSGGYNTVTGFNSLYFNTTGSHNTVLGAEALYLNSSGGNNTAIGSHSLLYNTIGGSNTSIGHRALYANTGNENIALGYNSGSAITSGSSNVVIGSNTGSTIATSSNNIIISDGAGNIRQQIDSTGRVGIGMTPSTYMLNVNGDINIPTGSNFKINGVNVGAGTITAVGASLPLVSTGGTTPSISMPVAATAQDGYLAAADWNAFNNKISSQWINNAADIYFNTGKVGIGTSTPLYDLDVYSNSAERVIGNSGNGTLKMIGGIVPGDSIAGAGNIKLTPGSSAYPGGDVIISGGYASNYYGTPGAKIEVKGSRYGGGGGNVDVSLGRSTSGTNNFNVYHYSGTSLMSVLDSGYVGIGKASPVYKLDVNGDINIPSGSNFKINGVNIGNGTINGSGTTNKISKFTAAGAIGDSNITDNGTLVSLSTDANINGVKIGRGNGSVLTNTTVGASALGNNTSGMYNTAVGYEVLKLNTTGSQNSAYGTSVLQANTTGYSNTAIGYNSMYENLTGMHNAAYGAYSLVSNTSGGTNTAIGDSSLQSNTTGNSNAGSGFMSLAFNTAGNFNTASGYRSLMFNTTGLNNTAHGSESLYGNTSGNNNTGLGYKSGYSITTGSNNVVIGSNDGSTIATTDNNIIISDGTGNARMQVDYSGAVGIGMAPNYYALSVNGDINIPPGSNYKINGVNAVVGFGTANKIPKFTASGTISNSNITDDGTTVAVSGEFTVNGARFGASTGLMGSPGTNTYVGYGALIMNQWWTGHSNTAMGFSSLSSNISGGGNTAMGMNALSYNTTGGGNTAVGASAIKQGTTGNYNSAFGYYALELITTGSKNTGLGYGSLDSISTGSNNTAIGYQSGGGISTGSNNVIIGSNEGNTIAESDNNIIISDGSGNIRIQTDYAGRMGIGKEPTAYMLDVAGDLNLAAAATLSFGGMQICASFGCSSYSDRNLKENIKPLQGSLENILKLEAVEYDYKDKAKFTDKHQIGVIAQDVEKVYPEVVLTDKKSGLKSVAYDHLVAPLIEAVKTLYDRIVNIEDHQAAQTRQMASVKAELKSKDQQIKNLKQENLEIKARLEKIEKALNK